MIRSAALTAAGLSAAAAAAAFVYRRFLREHVLDWGATPTEIATRLPGDDLLDDADFVATRAIGIDASPADVWPWLVQMGPGRGGVYTYDWIENLFGLNMHSTDRIHPEWQTMSVGDVWHNPQGGGMRTEIVDPERAIVLRSLDGTWVWSFVLATDAGRTRLISRNRFRAPTSLVGRVIGEFFMEPGSLVMERKMLLGIKWRSEWLAAERRAGGALLLA